MFMTYTGKSQRQLTSWRINLWLSRPLKRIAADVLNMARPFTSAIVSTGFVNYFGNIGKLIYI
jgi:hypothetical protein